MKYLRIVFIFSLTLIIFTGCEKEQVQPDTLSVDDGALKGKKVKKGPDKFVPFKASFELVAKFNKLWPLEQIDERNWPFMVDPEDFKLPPPENWPKGSYLDILGSGNATHLGKTNFTITQWWTKKYIGAIEKVSHGQGHLIFTAANGDILEATFYGTADHRDDTDGTEILTDGVFTGGTGRFENASGTFIWDGKFFGSGVVINPPNTIPDKGTVMGYGKVTVTGSIKY